MDTGWDNNNGYWNAQGNWVQYPNTVYQQTHPQQQQQSFQHHNANPSRPMSAISGAESIMGMYPIASITSVTHVTRHLMHPMPPIPSFMNSSTSYSLAGAMNYPAQTHQNQQQSSYPGRAEQLASATVPPAGTDQRQYWDSQQRHVHQLLDQQRHPSNAPQVHSTLDGAYRWNAQTAQSPHHSRESTSQYAHHAAPPSWTHSTFQTLPFASSILERPPYAISSQISNPSSVPHSITPSSLSMALAEPNEIPRWSHQPPASDRPRIPSQLPNDSRYQPNSGVPSRQHFEPSESAHFFDGFLAKTVEGMKTQQAPARQQPVAQPTASLSANLPAPPTRVTRDFFPRSTETPPKVTMPYPAVMPESSPDPLTMGTVRPPHVTPQKRKFEEPLTSPTLKRLQSMDGLGRPTQSAPKPQVPRSPSGLSTPRKGVELYVDVPPLPLSWKTPKSSRKLGVSGKLEVNGTTAATTLNAPNSHRSRGESVLSEVTVADPGSDDELALGSVLRPQHGGTVKSGQRTGERDQRGPMEKLTELMDDIFEAEDSLPPDADQSSLDTEQLAHFFSGLTLNYAQPLLSTSIITKLTRLISQVARPIKRLRLTSRDGALNTPMPAGLSDIEVGTFSRVLKLLARSVKLGEDLDPFTGPPPTLASTEEEKLGKGKQKAVPKKKTKPVKRARSGSRAADNDLNELKEDGDLKAADAASSKMGASIDDLEKLESQLQMAKESILAVDACLSLLSADKLPKQLYSEELITNCFSLVKDQLAKIIYQFTEASADLHGESSAVLIYVTTEDDAMSTTCRQIIGEIFQCLSVVIPRITALVSRTDLAMSESIIIHAIYIAIGPFFVVEFGGESNRTSKDKNSLILNALGGAATLRGLRLSALSLIRNIFALYPEQRSWIIEEILSSLIQLPNPKQKTGQFKLRDGRSIHTISALLLQLIQTSAHDVRIAGAKFSSLRLQMLSQNSQTNAYDARARDRLLSDEDKEEIVMYTSALDSANNSAKSIIAFLTTRSGKGKAAKTTKEADYRAIFDYLVEDLLTVLFWPEWPAASCLLGIATKYLISALEEKPTAMGSADSNGAKSTALDHLGVIAAKLRTTVMKSRQILENEKPLASLDEILSTVDTVQLERLIGAREDILAHLFKRSSDDQAYASARELTAATWGHDLARTLSRCESIVSKMSVEPMSSSAELEQMLEFATRLKASLHDVWKEATADVFDVGTEGDIARVDSLSEELGSTNALTNAYDAIVNVVLNALGSTVVFMRTKSLRALGQMIVADSNVLRKANVRHAIENHLHDLSPAVRDAAVDLIGKHVVQSQDVANDYYSVLSDRIADTGLSVRKRIIKLLKSLYETGGGGRPRQIDICTKLVTRMSDDDDSVKTLAIKTLEELWLSASSDARSASTVDTQNHIEPHAKSAPEERANSIAFVIMGVAANFGDRQSPLEDLFHQIASSKDGKESSIVFTRYQDICDALISSLVDQSESGFNLVSCIKTVHLLVSAHPPMMSSSNVRSLLPYLKNTTSKEDQSIAYYILKIYCVCIPHLPRTATQFATELQTTLSTHIQKPTNPAMLPDCIACFCAVIKHLTHDYGRVVGLFKSCNGRVQTIIARPEAVTGPLLRTLNIIIFILSLLCEHCDFDTVRNEQPDLASDINSVSQGPIVDHVYGLLLSLYEMFSDAAARGPILRCLGFLFRAQPTLLTRPQSAATMDAIFGSADEEARGRLLKIMQDFLVGESEKYDASQKAGKPKVAKQVKMEELVGNTDGFAESGVSSAIVQRYLPHILEAALSVQPRIQAAAVDILSFTIKQGLAHPLQCLPVIVALETSNERRLSARASGLHSILSNKHATLVNSRHLECARRSFEYQAKLRGDLVQGYRLEPVPIALLHCWYSLVREKRPTRQDFLKSILKSFDLDASGIQSSQSDVGFVRYMAENLSALDYKTQEEILTVIKHITSVLSVVGMQVAGIWRAQDGLSGPGESPTNPVHQPTDQDIPFARSSVIVCMLLSLKAYLKDLYGLSEDKCLKWVPGKKSALGDKPATKRRTDSALTWDRLTYAIKPILIHEDVARQREQFLAVWEEDGVLAEIPNDFDDI
ncbi:Sister chromatid cohesion protein 2 [Tulasnella sp. JGI-2019a]|nr:Sister chromatid cohesion protein 2 [Tulasnella sp. JGI-2019a]